LKVDNLPLVDERTFLGTDIHLLFLCQDFLFPLLLDIGVLPNGTAVVHHNGFSYGCFDHFTAHFFFGVRSQRQNLKAMKKLIVVWQFPFRPHFGGF